MQLQPIMKIWRHPAFCLVPGLLLAIVAFRPGLLSARSIVEAGNATVWRYLDDGKEPEAAWREVDFDDSHWKSGKAPLGYGRERLGTDVGWGTDTKQKFITTWMRHTFDRPDLKPGERLVLVFCVDDGAVFYLNGQELGRDNLTSGPLTANTTAPRAIGSKGEGFYLRMPVPVSALRPGRNVLAVEVHQCAPQSHDLFFDLAIKTMPPEGPMPAVPAAARNVVDAFNRQHYIGPGTNIPDGYEDGGRQMTVDAEGRANSHREVLRVDRTNDVELARDLAFARSAELQALPPLERARRLAIHIHQATTPPGGLRWVGKTTAQLQKEFSNRPVLIGDWVDQCQAGVCRHRSLLFKILADEAGLKASLVRGNYAGASERGSPHVWNEIILDDGRHLLVDVMLQRDRQGFPEVTAPDVARRYLRVDNTPWYTNTSQPSGLRIDEQRVGGR
ncbi:MAG: EDR1-related protein [Thermoguttaceae bacterium]